ncbi:DUF2490 domain-containing protein [Methylolobus aquaticus]
MQRLVPCLWALLIWSGWAACLPFQDFQIWTAITAKGTLGLVDPATNPIRFWLEGQGRYGNDSTTLSQGILRAGVGYALNDHSSLWLGYAYVPTMQPFTNQSRNEQRSWQQYLWSTHSESGQWNLRTRLEQRYRPDDNSKVGWRFRQQVKFSQPIPAWAGWSWVLSDELFINVNRTSYTNEGFNQNRIFFGLAYRLSASTHTEVGYLNQFSNRDGAPNQLHHILSLALYLDD